MASGLSNLRCSYQFAIFFEANLLESCYYIPLLYSPTRYSRYVIPKINRKTIRRKSIYRRPEKTSYQSEVTEYQPKFYRNRNYFSF